MINNISQSFILQLSMLQQPQQTLKISEDSRDFDPYLQPQTNDNYSSSDSDDNYDVQYYQKPNKKGKNEDADKQYQQPKSKIKAYHENAFTKLDNKINLHKITNQIDHCEQKELTKQKRQKDKADRATVEQVLDQRTRRILLKLLNNQIVTQINGCISTGKEANVYHALNSITKKEYAIKIYKTSILIFKDRDRYVEGEFRFRRGYCSSNPRKMVSMWAQKQLRNLKRMQGVINSPVGLLVKSNVLVMDFLGKDMINAPRLRDSNVTGVERWSEIYLEVIKIMRVLYQECKLIHADLSEYNMLYYENKVYVIDVSQSVQHDHPYALDFLRRDITNINDFFGKRQVNVFSDWHLFQFIVALGIQRGHQIQQLQKIMEQLELESKNGKITSQVEANVFKRISIPRTLGNISMEKVEKQLFDKPVLPSYHKVVTGVEGMEQAKTISEQKNEDDSESQSSSDSSSDDEDEEAVQKQKVDGKQGQQGQSKSEEKRVGGKQKYDGLSKLERKHKVKEDKRQKRKEKIPKKQKKRLTKKK